MDISEHDNLDRRIAERLRHTRQEQGLALEELAARSGVSRAMISKVERGEVNPTAALLGRLCAGLGIPLATLFAAESPAADPVARFADQPLWRDPGSGYIRRTVSPPGTGSAIEITEIEFPPGARVAFELPWFVRGIDQQIWVFEGTLEITVGEEKFRLQKGDCLHKRLDRPITYENPGSSAARYAVILTMEPRRR